MIQPVTVWYDAWRHEAWRWRHCYNRASSACVTSCCGGGSDDLWTTRGCGGRFLFTSGCANCLGFSFSLVSRLFSTGWTGTTTLCVLACSSLCTGLLMFGWWTLSTAAAAAGRGGWGGGLVEAARCFAGRESFITCWRRSWTVCCRLSTSLSLTRSFAECGFCNTHITSRDVTAHYVTSDTASSNNTVSQKTTHFATFNIFCNYSQLQWNLTHSFLTTLPTKRMHNFPLDLRYVHTLPENTLATNTLCCLPLTMCVALKCADRYDKKFSCWKETAWCFVSLNISLSHSRSLRIIQNDVKVPINIQL